MAWVNQRSDLQIQEIYRAIWKYGYIMHWTKASKCPCLTTDTGQPDANCTLCHGKGRFWSDDQIVRGIMQSISEKLMYNQTGEIMSGVSFFTTLPQYKLNIWDRIINFHSNIRYNEVITKGSYQDSDPLRFAPTKVVVLRTVSTVYTYKEDFDIDHENKTITWMPHGSEPAVGEQYSVDYWMHPSWIVVDPTNIIRDTYVKSKKPGITFQPLPQKVMVRLEYFVPEVM